LHYMRAGEREGFLPSALGQLIPELPALDINRALLEARSMAA